MTPEHKNNIAARIVIAVFSGFLVLAVGGPYWSMIAVAQIVYWVLTCGRQPK